MPSQEIKNATRFIDIALSMHLITDMQYISTSDYWNNCGGDMATVMVGLGLITQEQADTIAYLIEQDVAFPDVKYSQFQTTPLGHDFPEQEEDSLFDAAPESQDESETSSFGDVQAKDANIPARLEARDELFGQYSYLGLIGQGGLGQVTRCCDRSFDRDIALKEIRADLAWNKQNSRLMQRFWLEARVTGQLQHPGIVPVHEMGIKPDGSLYYTMKHVQGTGFDKALEEIAAKDLRSELRYTERLRYLNNFIDICRAIGYAHDKGVIHRDLKPANVILGRHGETIILDWGLAKLINAPDPMKNHDDSLTENKNNTQVLSFFNGTTGAKTFDTAEITMAGEVVGTPSYMAPEQIDKNFGAVDKQSDVYALGVFLYRIITGISPYNAKDVRSLLREICDTDKPVAVPTVSGVDIPPDLVAICVKAMSKEKNKRFANANELANEIEAFQEGRLVSIFTYTPREYLRRFVRRNKLAASFLLIAVIGILGGLIFSSIFAYQARIGHQQARQEAEVAVKAQALAENNRMQADEAKATALQTVEQLPKFADLVLNCALTFSDAIEGKLTQMRKELEELSTNAVLDNVLNDPGTLEQTLKMAIKNDPYWLSFVVTDSSGTVCGIEPSTLRRSIGVNLTNQSHIQQALETKRTICGNLFENPEKTFTGIAIVTPIMRNGQLTGLLCGVFNPNEIISSVINEQSLGPMMMGLALDKKGYVLLDESYPDKIFRNLFADPFYESNTDFLAVCMKIFTQPFGVDHYKWIPPGQTKDEIHRIIAWREIDMSSLGMGDLEKWGIMVMGSFMSGQRELMTRDSWVKLFNNPNN